MIDRPYHEEHVRTPILAVLEHADSMETAQITRLVRSTLDLAPSDLEQANKRANEVKIDQIIANALNAGRFLCKKGLIERIGKGHFRITEEGRAYIAKERTGQAEMGTILNEMIGDLNEMIGDTEP